MMKYGANGGIFSLIVSIEKTTSMKSAHIIKNRISTYILRVQAGIQRIFTAYIKGSYTSNTARLYFLKIAF